MEELDLRRELQIATDAMQAVHFDRLRKLGVSFDAITRAGGLGVLKIARHGRTFTPTPNGTPAWIVGCWYPEPPGLFSGIPFPEAILEDLVAFDREGWWFRSGDRVQVLGQPEFPASPFAWLQEGCRSCCPLGLVETEAAA